MNIGEANDFFKVVRSLSGEPLDETATASVLEAAARLTERANRALDAGPTPADVCRRIQDALWLIDEATQDTGGVMTYTRPVETHEPLGGVL